MILLANKLWRTRMKLFQQCPSTDSLLLQKRFTLFTEKLWGLIWCASNFAQEFQQERYSKRPIQIGLRLWDRLDFIFNNHYGLLLLNVTNILEDWYFCSADFIWCRSFILGCFLLCSRTSENCWMTDWMMLKVSKPYSSISWYTSGGIFSGPIVYFWASN